MSITQKIFGRIERLSGNQTFSLWRTLYLNFRTLPFEQAVRLPLRVYGRIRMATLAGRIELPEQQAVWRIGLNYAGYRHRAPGRICLMNGATLVLHPDVKISQGANIFVSENATLVLNESSTVGDSADIVCYRHVELGKHSDLTWDCQLTDFNSHFIQLSDGTIPTILKPVKIGDYCWIGNRTTIMPGTVLPTRTIVASNSLLNKDYSQFSGMHALLAGKPAKYIRGGVSRIYDRTEELRLLNLYRNNT